MADTKAAALRAKTFESIYCPCCGGGIVECGCTWRPDHYCMKHAQWCPPARKLERAKEAKRGR